MDADSLRDRYLDLMQRALINVLYQDIPERVFVTPGYIDSRPNKFLPKYRELGRDLPSQAHTSIGRHRLENIRHCIEQILADQVSGDLIETGVWRGGAVIFMRAVLLAYGVTDRTVWVADSFAGLPEPNPDSYPADLDWRPAAGLLAVSHETVEEHFRRYDLLDGQVRFLAGWFKDTLPAAPIEHLSLLRLDGDLYESTMDALTHLYPKLSVGGYVIVDDYNLMSCRSAITDFRATQGIDDPMHNIDGWSVYWRRSG